MMPSKNLILGTAMWGWTMTEQQCYTLLDQYYAAGGRQVDCATNYPINKNPQDFRKAEKYLLHWIAQNDIIDLEVMMKVGSLDNSGSPHHRLQKSFLLFTLEDYLQRFGENLHTFMIHWDNRDDKGPIKKSLEALAVTKNRGLQIGLSGIRHPEIYANLNQDFGLHFRMQCKHNLLYSDLDRYRPLREQADFIAYGINAGGIKLDPQQYRKDASLLARGKKADLSSFSEKISALVTGLPEQGDRPPVSRMNHLGLIYAFYHPAITAILSGPSRSEQLQDSLVWMQHLQAYDYTDVYRDLSTLAAQKDFI